MDSDWFTRINYQSILGEQLTPNSRYGVQNRLRALLDPAIKGALFVSQIIISVQSIDKYLQTEISKGVAGPFPQ